MILGKKEVTKIYVKKRCQEILKYYPRGIWLPKEDKEFLVELLKNHPRYEIKKGKGIKGFKIRKGVFNQKMFELYRIDNSFTDFSYLRCLNDLSFEAQIKSSCREAIEKDILNFKIRKFEKEKVFCEVSGIELSFNNCHVDHFSPTFKQIYELWRIQVNISKNDLSSKKSIDNEERIWFTNEKLRNHFRTFHNSICNLKIVSPQINLEVNKK